MPRGHAPLALLVLTLGCAGFVAAQGGAVQTLSLSDGSAALIDWAAGGSVQAPGSACSADTGGNEAERTALRDEAVSLARRRLLEAVGSIPVTAGLSTADAMGASDMVRTGILELAARAAVLEGSEIRREGCIELVLAVPLEQVRAALPPDEIARIMASPIPPPEDPSIAALLAQARDFAIEALGSDLLPSPDQRVWIDALERVDAAYRQAPDERSVLLARARIYSYVGWHIRAWDYWRDYLDAGGRLVDPPDLAAVEIASADLFARVGSELGFARYQAGLFDEALGTYLTVLARLPDDREALGWAARIYFEQGRSAEALPLWERLAALQPDDEGADYFLQRTRERLTVGLEASDAFQSGLVRYESGDLPGALSAFETALGLNDTFVPAAVWAGRTSLELGEPQRSRRHWNRVLELDPGDDRAWYFLELADAQVQWGVDSANQFFRGQQLYEQGDVAGAADSFAAAARGNTEYLQAWVWAARTHQELGRPADAISFWQAVLERNGGDPEARSQLELARQQLRYGVDAGRFIAAARNAFEQGELELAATHFRDAIEVEPALAEAWGWLGRIHFARAEYLEAARHYERALELEPGNDDYRFFAEEARRLAP